MVRPVHLTDSEYEEITLRVQELLDQLEGLPESKTRDILFELLQGFDALHREALARIVRSLESEHPSGLQQLQSDNVVMTLLGLYDLVTIPEDNPVTSSSNGFVPLDQIDVIEPIRQPVWIPGGSRDDYEKESMHPLTIDGVAVLLCHVQDGFYALHNACLGSILALHPGSLEQYVLSCPWHGCRYDIRSGELLGEAEGKLRTFPVQIDDSGRLMIGFNIPDHRIGVQ